MPEYINPNNFTVHLTGPDGKVIKVKSRQKVSLSDYFDRYRARGFIKLANNTIVQHIQPKPKIQAQIQIRLNANKKKSDQVEPVGKIDKSVHSPEVNVDNNSQEAMLARRKRREDIAKARRLAQTAKITAKQSVKHTPVLREEKRSHLGRAIASSATKILESNLESDVYPISNNIGIGILSYERKACLERLINSILAYTDLSRTTVFVSDDGSQNRDLKEYLDDLSINENIVVLRNKERLGIAGNSNRLLQCLSRFAFGMLLNDDVEVLSKGWDTIYPEMMLRSKLHHFIYRQEGVYGADKGSAVNVNGIICNYVKEKPHGAVLAFTNHMLDTCGFFNEEYGLYGMEHVDWSNKAYEFGLQPMGYYDVPISSKYFRIHKEESAVNDKSNLLKAAKNKFESRTKERCNHTNKSAIEGISYVIPYRNIDRTDSILTVVNNIRAQRYPVIDIYLSEQDNAIKVDLDRFKPVRHSLVSSKECGLFNKSKAFNHAVAQIKTEKLIMHDADLLVTSRYTSKVSSILDEHEACHIGKTVIYADPQSTEQINQTGKITKDVVFERVVGYYEGGSIACRKSAYWKCGGFNEDFWGYGCEDCDFFARLASMNTWYETRTFDLLHLYHGRVEGWNSHHDLNKDLEKSLKRRSMLDRVHEQYKQLRANGYGSLVDAYRK